MATISVKHNHSLGQEEAMKRVEEILNDVSERVKADIAWNGSNASFKGTGFSGTAQVLANSINFDLDLNMLLRPMKGKIESRIEKLLAERFS